MLETWYELLVEPGVPTLSGTCRKRQRVHQGSESCGALVPNQRQRGTERTESHKITEAPKLEWVVELLSKGETGLTVWAYRNQACLNQHSTEGCPRTQGLIAQNTICSYSGIMTEKVSHRC